MLKYIVLFSFFFLSACGDGQGQVSEASNFLEGGGWNLETSPYMLKPGTTIAICDSTHTGKTDLIIDAVKIWLQEGGRDDRLKVVAACKGDRVIQLVKLAGDVDFYGRAHPLVGNVNNVDVPSQWAGHWTANHEVGHIFGFAHIFNHTVSIMNSEDNGKYMNGGELSDYDRSEIRRMLSLKNFAAVNKLWQKPTGFSPQPPLAPTPASPPASTKASCLGADQQTLYPHGRITTYQGDTYTCNNGAWIFSEGTY